MQISARWFPLKDKALAVAEKERTGAILVRREHPTLGPGYEVRYLPPPEEPRR